jgi:hypothetical protein
MTKSQELIDRLQTISELIDLDNFYAIGLSPNNNQISLQGRFTDTTARFAKSIDVDLVYENDTTMLKGESPSGTVRIVLT